MSRGQRPPDCDIDLGLAVSRLSLRPGESRTAGEIAAFCGCSRAAIEHLFDRALRRFRLLALEDPTLREFLETPPPMPLRNCGPALFAADPVANERGCLSGTDRNASIVGAACNVFFRKRRLRPQGDCGRVRLSRRTRAAHSRQRQAKGFSR